MFAVPASAGGGSATNADACQKGEWQNRTRADGGGVFKSQGDCVAYLAQADKKCGELGGTFGNTNLTEFPFSTIDWTCNGFIGGNTAVERAVIEAILRTYCPHSLTVIYEIDSIIANATCGTATSA